MEDIGLVEEIGKSCTIPNIKLSKLLKFILDHAERGEMPQLAMFFLEQYIRLYLGAIENNRRGFITDTINTFLNDPRNGNWDLFVKCLKEFETIMNTENKDYIVNGKIFYLEKGYELSKFYITPVENWDKFKKVVI